MKLEGQGGPGDGGEPGARARRSARWRRGARVVVVLRSAARTLAGRGGGPGRADGEAHALAATSATRRPSTRSPARPPRWSGPIDVLVHNASTLGPTPLPLLLDTECEDLSSACSR